MDPFSHEGDTVATLAAAWNLTAHAVEIEEKWGQVAQERFGLTRAIVDDAYSVTMSHGAFPVIWLNPPFDKDDTSYEARRAEYKALQYFWKYLQPDGLMLWTAYVQHLSRSVATSFFRNCHKVDVYRFPELHLDHYTQVLVIGHRHNEKRVPNDTWVMEMSERFSGLSKTPELLRDITLGVRPPKDAPEDFDARYDLPKQATIKQFMFVPNRVDPNVLLKLHLQFGAQRLPTFVAAIATPIEAPIERPIAPPRPGQLAVTIASGMLNGVPVIHNGRPSIIRGSVKRADVLVSTEESKDENGRNHIVETFHNVPQPQIVVLSSDGTIDNITEDAKLVDFIELHRDELMVYFVEKYKPKYDMTIDPLWSATYDALKVRGVSDLLTTQEYVASAATEHLALNRALIIVGEPATGKAQPLDAKILTPAGWKRMRDMQVGDQVIDPTTGKPVQVIGVFPQGKKPIYRVTFKDGSSTECSDQHLWDVTTPEIRWRNQAPKAMTLADIQKNYIGRDGRHRYTIPTTEPVEFSSSRYLPIDPYVLGVLLGDGCLTRQTPMFSSADPEIVASLTELIPDGANVKFAGGYDYRISGKRKNKHNLLAHRLADFQLAGTNSTTKFIPREYKYAPVADRTALLQGLLDTDGHIAPNGRANGIEYVSVSPTLARDVRDLVWSLGGEARLTTKATTYTYKNEKRSGQLAYRLYIMLPPDVQPFRLTRKTDAYSLIRRGKDKQYRAFAKIEYVGEKEAQCILVDSQSHLYITNDYIVTHNTAMTIAAVANLVKIDAAKRGNRAALDSLLNRYQAQLKDVAGMMPGDVVFVVCPGIMPEKWTAEITQMYPQAVVERINTVLDAKHLFDAAEQAAQNGSDKVFFGISTYEDVKLSEGWAGQFQIKNIHGKLVEVGDDGFRHSVINTNGLAIDPICGERIMDRVGGELRPMDPKRINGRQRFYDGTVFDGYQRIANPNLAGRYMKVRTNKTWPERDDPTAVTEFAVPGNGFALWGNKRLFGLPKQATTNGVVSYKEVDRVVKGYTSSMWIQSKFVNALDDKQDWIEVPYTIPDRTMKERVITSNLWLEEKILDPWLALKGIRCYDSATRRSPIEAAMKKSRLKAYTLGGGNVILDALLRKYGLHNYYAGDGMRVLRNPRYPIGAYIARRYKGRIGLLVVDELHRSKGMDTDQGVFVRSLAYASKKILGLTGTLYGGVASSIYALEFAFNPNIRRRFPWVHGIPLHWIKTMGVLEDIYETKATYSNGQFAGVKRFASTRAKEVPGASPLLVPELMDHCLFVGLKDMGAAMPEFEEIPVEVEMGELQAAVYDECYRELRDINAKLIVKGDRSFTGAMYRALLQLPDSMFRENIVMHRKVIDREARKKSYTEEVLFVTPSIGSELQPKETKLAELVNEIIDRGERVIVFVSQTATRDIQPRILTDVLGALCPDARPFILYSDTVKPEFRDGYIRKQVAADHNVMICNPRLVAEGVDLIEFNNTIYLEIEPSLLVMGQSSRRTWRLNQPKSQCRVYYLYYNDVYQKSAVQAIAEKTAAANTLYGNEGGSLSAMSKNTSDLFALVAELVRSGMRLTADELRAKFKHSAYTEKDYQDSSWYGPARKEKHAPVFAQPDSNVVVTTEESLEVDDFDTLRQLEMFG